jgi:hypothetical protein
MIEKKIIISKSDLVGVLEKGILAHVKHRYIYEPVPVVIQKVDNNIAFFKVPVEFLKNNVMVNDTIEIMYFAESYAYVFCCEIINISVYHPYYVHAKVNTIERFLNERKCKRYMVNLSSTITVLNKKKDYYGVIKNLSISGAGIIINKEFDEDLDEEVLVTLEIDQGKTFEMLSFKAKLIRTFAVERYKEYGVEITELDSKNKELLNEFLCKLEIDEKELIKKSLD